ncbi:hypothetical protein [Dysgonomonas capnocytophagoides]|uniref:hypothetical protein n=1 Tax=Dysgonomonas capnocytophagoides TaxID=45254 RepID=UPI0012FB0878|nr:hypothetical protein [Dysgonomonas capnocytophagoides]
MEEALSLASTNCKVSLHSIYDLALNGTFHVHVSGARLCFDCIKTLALANRQRENRSRWSQFRVRVTDPFIYYCFISK